MTAISNGIRLEPHVRRGDSVEGLRARVHDPLWLLARQWQFGEFQADDAGSPALVDLDGESARLTHYRLGPLVTGAATPYPTSTLPLEALVEREALQPTGTANVRLTAEAGMQFLRLLDVAGAARYTAVYRTAFALQSPPPGDAVWSDVDSALFVGVMAGRALDAPRLYASLSAAFGARGEIAGTLPPVPAIPASDAPMVTQAARAWLAWYADQGISQPSAGGVPAWKSERMEYEFSVAARTSQNEVVLAAPEYFEGRLDWMSFVINPSTTLGATMDTRTFGGRLLPAPVTFRGMPASRFWEFEDARVNLADKLNQVDADAPARDVAQMLLLEFALVYGNDWFLIPVVLDVGTLNRVRSLLVTDTFGIQTSVQHASAIDGAASPWRMFNLSMDSRAAPGATAPADLFFLAPTLGPSLDGPLLEDVLFLRDEMANMGWAVERVVESPLGRPLDRAAAFHAADGGQSSPPPPLAGDSAQPRWSYRLGSEVPEYWIPLLPGDAGWLQRGTVPNRYGQLGRPRGVILEPARVDMHMYDEEVPREGVRVTRGFQYARWVDGSAHVWLGRRKVPGRGPGSSGLRFDTLEPWQPRLLDAPDLADGMPALQIGVRASVGGDTRIRRLGS